MTMRAKSVWRALSGLMLGVSLFLGAGQAAAVTPASGPKATLMRLNGDVDKLLRKKTVAGSEDEKQTKQTIKERASELIDYTELGKRALNEQWAKLSAKQQTEFIDTFKELIERNYVKQLRTNLSYDVKYGDEVMEPAGSEAKVTTTIRIDTKGKATEALIEYRMLKHGDAWMVYDIITDELSLVRNYRSQFQRIMNGSGYDGLLTKMKTKLAEERTAAGEAPAKAPEKSIEKAGDKPADKTADKAAKPAAGAASPAKAAPAKAKPAS